MIYREKEPENLRSRVRKAAHDVRSPLTSIAGFAQLLIDDTSLSPDARKNAGIILEETKQLSDRLELFFDEITEMVGVSFDNNA